MRGADPTPLSSLAGRLRSLARTAWGRARFAVAALGDDSDGALALVRRLLSDNARAYAPHYALAILCMLVAAVATAASAWVMRDIINGIFVDRRADLVVPIAATVLGLFTLKGAASYAQAVILGRIGASLIARVQKRIADALLAQSMAFFDRADSGELTTRMAHNANAARGLLDALVTAIGRDLVTVVALLVVMVLQDPLMAFLALLVAPPAVIGVAALVKRVRSLARREFLSQARIVHVMNETIRGIKVVKAFTLEQRMRAQLYEAIGEVEARTAAMARLNALSSPLMETLGGVSIAIVILYAGFSVISLGGDPGAFFAFMTAFLLAYDPAKRLARLRVSLQQNLVGVRLLYELLDHVPTLLEEPGARDLVVGTGHIRLDDVRFGYAGRPVLDGLTLDARPGTVTALVGPSGAGKSTVFTLIARFYDPASGTVTIDGQDIRGVTLASLRQAIAFVTQDTFLFSGSIRDNILCGRPGAGDAEMRAAAEAANVAEFVAGLPDGYETEVGEGGSRLSGGQRQRVAIARAMLRDAPILLLDEATSALDAESEARVQEALERLMRGRTTLVIAHRLATVRGADRIVVLREGRVTEQGTHAELIAAGGLYSALHALQFRDAAA